MDSVPQPRLFQRGASASSGSPTVTEEFFASAGGQFRAGYWASAPQKVAIAYDKDEICVLLEGSVVLTDSEGRATTYRKGDTFVIPRGFQGTWETVEPVQKFYAIASFV